MILENTSIFHPETWLGIFKFWSSNWPSCKYKQCSAETLIYYQIIMQWTVYYCSLHTAFHFGQCIYPQIKQLNLSTTCSWFWITTTLLLSWKSSDLKQLITWSNALSVDFSRISGDTTAQHLNWIKQHVRNGDINKIAQLIYPTPVTSHILV